MELLQDENNPVWKWFPNNMAMMQLADYLIANGVTVQEWIPVTERLPEKLVPVLIQHTYMEWAGISIGYITSDDYWEWFGYFMGDDMLHHPPGDGLICPGSKYVTRWMPLPEPYTAKVEDDDNARQVKPAEFDQFKNDTLKDAQPTTPAHWEKTDIPLPYQMRTVPTPSGTFAHREMYVCSACDGYNGQNTQYCPHCGARMDRKDGNG